MVALQSDSPMLLAREDPMLMEIELGSTPPSPAAGAVTHLASPIDDIHQRVASPPPDHSASEDNINLEAVHFEVQGADQVCCESALRNITVARVSHNSPNNTDQVH